MPMKHLVALAFAVLFAFALSACGSEQVDLSDYPWELEECAESPENLDENITLSFVDGSLTPEGATVVLENNSDETFEFGAEYHLYLKANGKVYLMQQSGCWTLELLSVAPHDSYTWDMNWSGIYGTLPAGQYLFAKTSSLSPDKPYCVVCEFEIT